MNMRKRVENAASLMNMWTCWHVDGRDRISQKSWKWIQKLIFHLFYIPFLSDVSAFD